MTTAPLLATLLSLAATFLGLSLLVQVIQEVWKYLTSSKARSYEQVLIDFLGPHAMRLKQPGTLPDLLTRGPFQLFFPRRPQGLLQPMDKQTLVTSLERTAAPWIQRALALLHTEAELQKGARRKATPAFRNFLTELAGVERGSPGYFSAVELREFLAGWEDELAEPDAQALLLGLRQRFLPSVIQAEANFTQLTKNVEYAYRRRNLRQTFLFGLGLALVFQLPADRLYLRAGKVPLDQAIAAAEQARAIYAQEAARDTAAARRLPELERLADSLRRVLVTGGAPASLNERISLPRIQAEFATPRSGFVYLLGCLLTSLLISFGAPFWNDLSGVLLRVAKGSSLPMVESKKDED